MGKVRERIWGDGNQPRCALSPQSFPASLPLALLPPKFPKLGGNPCLDALEFRFVEEVKGMVYRPQHSWAERGNKHLSDALGRGDSIGATPGNPGEFSGG